MKPLKARDPDSDLAHLNRAREKVMNANTGVYLNSLVEWTLSEAWTRPADRTPVRGSLTIGGARVHSNECFGVVGEPE